MNEAKKQKGHRLRVELKHKIFENGDNISNIAIRFGISQSYLSQLINGDKLLAGVDDDLLRKFAAYLDIPCIAAFLMAERLYAADFISSKKTHDDKLKDAMAYIYQSPSGIESGVSESELEALPEKVKLLIVLLFQKSYSAELKGTTSRWFFYGNSVD